MFVHLKQDMSYTTIGRVRVYGKKYAYGSMGPSELDMQTYDEYKEILNQAPYPVDWLVKKFNRHPPIAKFTIEDIKHNLNDAKLKTLASYVGIKLIPNGKLTKPERYAIRRSIIFYLEGDGRP